MKQFLYLLTVVLLCSFSSCANAQNRKSEPTFIPSCVAPDSSVYQILGRSLSDVLFNPKKVTVYHLKGKETVAAKDFEVEPHYVRDSLVCCLSRPVWTILQYNVLANASNYQNDSIPVRSPYVPEYEIVFTKGKNVAHVVVSLSDFSWSVVYDDKKQFNFNYADKPSMQRWVDLVLRAGGK